MEENVAIISLLQHPPRTTVTLKMKAVRYTETSEYFITIRHRNPKDDHKLTKNRRQNLKTHNWFRVKKSLVIC
jgi:hypothetical protein